MIKHNRVTKFYFEVTDCKNTILIFYRINGDDDATINLHLVKNKEMGAGSIVYTDTDDRLSFYSTQNVDIDGRQYADSDMVEVSIAVTVK